MGEEKEISQMLGSSFEITLKDGKKYKLGQLTVSDLVYFEEKFGSIDVLFTGSTKKPFTVILNVLYRLLLKNQPELQFEDLDKILPVNFLTSSPELLNYIISQLGGSIKEGSDPKNPLKPIEKVS